MISIPEIRIPPHQGFWQIHEVASVGPWSFPPHRHNGFGDLMLVCEGTVTNVVNGNETRLHSGSIAWTRERDLHEVHGTRFRFMNLNLSDERLERLALAIGHEKEFRRLQTRPDTPSASLGTRAAQLEKEWEKLFHMQRGPAADLMASAWAMQFLTFLLMPGLDAEDIPSEELPAWLQAGLSHIEACIEDGVTVSELATVCARSPEHISRSFRKLLGMSPSAWINQQRINRASLLLSATNRELLDICYGVGFQSPSYFYRLFRDQTGATPHQYRHKHNPMAS